MTKMIKCTNPSCKTLINVPEGAMQLICPDCNTWHFPSAVNKNKAYTQHSENESYGLPPSQEESNANTFGNEEMPPLQYQTPGTPLKKTESAEQTQPPTTPQNKTADKTAMAFLVTDLGRHLELKEGKNIIGRKNTDLIIDDRTVSRKHCVIEVTANDSGLWEYSIYDIGHLEGNSSTNGVFVSGRSLRLQDYERIPLVNGTSIHIGNVELKLHVR